MSYDISDVIRHFAAANDITEHGNGHINDTYLADCSPRCILQKMNTAVFKNPEHVMENIVNITEHLRAKIKDAGGDENRETLRVIKTTDGENFYRTPDGDCFRMFNYVDSSVSYDTAENPNQLFEAARAFGRFQNMLADYPADKLYETIPDFHDTRKRFENLKRAINEDKCGRLKEVQAEVDFALSRESDVGIIVDAIADGSVPVRVTHNDTKLNNVMFDAATDKAVCVIDLDTVMPGSLLYDYGDALRFGAATAAEDETDLDKMLFDLEMFEAFTKGFLSEVGSNLSQRERELLPFSAKLMTYECGIRFLTDYLEGDTYFKIHKEKHNLDRCRTQFKLVADMEQKLDEMKSIVAKYSKGNNSIRVMVCKDYAEMSKKAAAIVAGQITTKPNSVLGLATGSTPVGLYDCLVEKYENGELDFSKVTTVNLDEYYPISPDNDQSYRYFMDKHLFDRVNINKKRTFVPNGMAEDPIKECADYEKRIKQLDGIDLQILGIGQNGHIGFNEPANSLSAVTHLTGLTENTIEANSRFFESKNDVPTKALTMGMGTILQSKCIILLASGAAKKDAVGELLTDSITTDVPATLLKVHSNVVLICDKDAYPEG